MKETAILMGQKHTVEANVAGLGDDTILVEYMPVSALGEMEQPIRDTVFSTNGRFSYSPSSNEPILLYLFPKKGEFTRTDGRPFRPETKYIVLLVNPLDKLTIQGELEELFLEYQVEGSEFNEQYAQVRKEYIETISEAVSLELGLDTLMAINGDKDLINQLFKTRNEINSISRSAQLEYVKNNPDKDLSAFYLIKQPLKTFETYQSALTNEVRDGMFKNALQRQQTASQKYAKVEEAARKVIEGEIAPDFKVKSLSGDWFLDAVQGKYLVLDFWGSWCPPCIKGLPKMKDYYARYQDKIEFISINCNEPEANWKKAIEKYALPWPQVINNTAIATDVSIMYGVKAFPTKFILDRNKKIIAKFIGEDDSFYKKVDELMAVK